MSFKISPVKQKTDYAKKHPCIRKPYALLLFAGFLSLLNTSCSNACKPLAGSPAIPPADIQTKKDMTDFMEMYAKQRWDITFIRDYPLEISNQGTTIEFVADGYNAENKIAYEFIGLDDYYSNINFEDALSPDEINAIKYSRFGEYYIIILQSPYSGIARDIFNNTMYQIKIDHEKPK
jgi:hypothetical protein